MPVTPVFSIDQDDGFVYVTIRVPYVRVSDVEYVVDGQDLSFFVKPYLLKLHFPFAVLDDDNTKAVYDPKVDNGTIKLHLPKAEKGLVFPDLDLLTKLQQPRVAGPKSGGSGRVNGGSSMGTSEPTLSGDYMEREEQILREMGVARPGQGIVPSKSAAPTQPDTHVRHSRPLIEVVSSVNFDETTDNFSLNDSVTDDVEKDEGIKQTASAEQISAPPPKRQGGLLNPTSVDSVLSSMLEKTDISESPEPVVQVVAPSYGFNNSHKGFFHDIMNEFPELIDLPDPDVTASDLRRKLRMDSEDIAFNEERYVGDFFGAEEDPIFVESMAFKAFWEDDNELIFTESEQEQMRQLQNREFLAFTDSQVNTCLCAIVDVLFCYAFECRTTQDDPGVESSWTIRVLSSTLSWLDEFQLPEDAVEANLHRMLTYPYLRHMGLSMRVVKDLCTILSKGRRMVVKCLLAVHKIFSRSDMYYLLNRLYITDMCVWIQQVDAGKFDEFAAIAIYNIQKRIIGQPYKAIRWDLSDVESSYSVTNVNN